MDWADLIDLSNATLVAAFGEPTTYTPNGGAAVPVQGVFDAAYVRVDVGEAGVASPGPVVFYRTADLPADPDTDDPRIVILGLTYRVIESEKDGQGGVLLRLHRV